MRFRICWIACLIGLVACHAAMAQPLEGLLWQESPDPIWTDRPVRIDRSKQTYERITGPAQLIPSRIKVPKNVRISDSATFSIGDSIYLVEGVTPLAPRKLCRDAAGRVLACGQQARGYLRKLIQGRTLRCFHEFLAKQTWFVDCRIGERSLAEMLVTAGAAFAAAPALVEFQRTSQMNEKGIWSDVDCQTGRCS